MTDQALPDRRPADFTLGVVVFGDEDASDVSSLSARYIVDASGYLRASVGAGSDAATYPKITRRLNEEHLDQIWTMLDGLDLNEPSTNEAMPTDGYLIEIRSGQTNWVWVVENGLARAVVGLLAEFAWIVTK
tara:strand:+ start:180 stop:575 length:396 start_codon:yes stop_codon:yes gene_type:complete